MKHRKAPASNHVFDLAGGNEDNSLFVETMLDNDRNPVMMSVWEPNEEERKALAEGATIELWVWGTNTPPVAIQIGPSMDKRKEAHDNDQR